MDDALALAWVRNATASGAARDIRRAGRLSRSEMARAVGVHVATIASWEQGTRAPHGEQALRYASLLRGLARVAQLSSIDRRL
jgi:DNA-binding transcriptional regulator YiaG